ncbi:unnamed protein product (mitochondrion) [Plasmodiophora brassicae]|uniref:Thioredoxin domain-containing protein n=1 Tax=Plasmodiophora brassicae TaxID=37360 RepID=A0A0G4J052_PLABS|nr:hypothetical protein PBRA_001763 [Plasmodiophora brassicae]SPQ93809.1 unnamed protein product [Plasmodiophora brassicae]
MKQRPTIPIQTREEAVAALAAHDALQEARRMEKQVNAAAAAMEEASLEDLRRKRIAELQSKQSKALEWRAKGHGFYTEVSDQKHWFEATKASERTVTHFYRPTTPLCELVDAHLTKIAANHVETKFLKINAEKSPFLCDRMDITVLPTVVMLKDGNICDKIIGFETVPNLNKCSTEDFERRLAFNGAIDYEGDPRRPKGEGARKEFSVTNIRKSKLHRGTVDTYSDDEDDD